MSESKFQKGSAHLIIIIILALALLGAVGYIFYDKFILNSDIAQDDDDSSQLVDNENNFDITEWNITGEYNGEFAIQYTISDDNKSVGFKSNKLPSNCADYLLAIIVRLSGDESMDGITYGSDSRTVEEAYAETEDSVIKKVGNYYYLYESPQEPCYENPNISNSYDSDTYNTVNYVRSYFNSLKEM